MKEKYVLHGVFTKFDQKTRNRPYYSEEDFNKALEDYNRKHVYQRRKEIVDKLLKNFKSENEL
jgi:hypothetical protein